MSQAGLIAGLTSRWEKLLCRSTFVSRIYSRPYQQVVRREIQIASISTTDVVLNVGCGAVPFSAMYTALFSGARVWAVERQPDAARLAEKCINSWGLQKQVDVITADAACSIPQGFTAALVALQAEPKEAIFRRLCEAAGPGARLVFREPSTQFAGQYDSLADLYQADGFTRQDMVTFDRSLLYRLPAHANQRSR